MRVLDQMGHCTAVNDLGSSSISLRMMWSGKAIVYPGIASNSYFLKNILNR